MKGMPDNKRQHFVPQNYLREFSPDGESIGVFLVEHEKCIKKAPINSQAQESYFYGKSLELEKQLSELECLLAENRRTIFSNQTNKLSLYQREVLYQDMMLQLSRTKQMADLYEEMATANARRMWKHSNNELIRQHADDFCVKYENVYSGNIGNASYKDANGSTHQYNETHHGNTKYQVIATYGEGVCN